MKLPNQFKYAFHRTQEPNVVSIARSGFTPGGGDMYGKGWYMCYDLDSQLNRNMILTYGDAVIKSELYAKGLLIFDYNVAKKVYGSDYTLVQQALEQDIYRDEKEIPREFFQMSRVLEDSFKNPTFSAAIAANAWVGGQNPTKVGLSTYMDKGWQGNPNSFLHPSLGTPKNKRVTSIMFTGNHDGNVVVVYSPNTAKPIDYTIISLENLDDIKSTNDIEWKPVEEAETANKRANFTRELYELFRGDILNIEIEPGSSVKSVSAFKSKYPWLIRAKFSSAVFQINDDDSIVMASGIWNGGTFKGLGMDRDVVFRSGVFEGTDFHGLWEAGRWNKPDDTAWTGRTNSKSKFTYQDGDEFVQSKEAPDEYFR